MVKQGVLDTGWWELRAASGKFSKKSCGDCAIGTFGCFRAILYGGSMEGFWLENANLWSVIRDYGRLLGWLWAFWTAGITGHPLDIGSTSCTTIFQVSNRTIRCILDRSGGCWEDFIRIFLSSVVWLAQSICREPLLPRHLSHNHAP
jgi:hypothetical protein